MENNKTFLLYARKSTDAEDKQVLSIEAQIDELREFAIREHLTIVGEYIEKCSAKKPGRPFFNAMLDRIEAGEANGILSWHPDRLARNMTDGGRILDFLDQEKLVTLKFPTFWFESTPQGKFMLGMAFTQGKYYVDALSVNTKRGLRQKVRRGECPGAAPLGYLNDPRTKRIVVDIERAPVVKEAFALYASGDATLETIREHFRTNGILTRKNKRSKGGKPIALSRVSDILTNPFYYGHFRYTGELHEGIHEPIISKTLFDEVQSQFANKWASVPMHKSTAPKAFLGLLRCSQCGGAITGELQKGRVYYRCTKKSKKLECSQPYIREDSLATEVSRVISPYALRADWANEMTLRANAEREEGRNETKTAVAVARTKTSSIDLQLKELLEFLLDHTINRETFAAKKSSLLGEKKTLEDEIAALTRGGYAWLEPFKKWVSEAKLVGEIAATGSLTEKKVIAEKIFGSNLVLSDKTARGEAVKPWSFLAVNELSHDMVSLYNAARTYFQGHFPV